MNVGTKLGPYEITSAIGAGGMGEVYRARDTQLGRDVAIKVLPENFSNDPERLTRFQREARMLAALNHPNIATIYGLEQTGGATCLVMELVPGETLAERVKAGPVPVEEALKVATQIAEALEAAHEKGIVHRDLKPANVKVTPEGKVKVLDFGLAKAFEDNSTNEVMNNSPTLTVAATMQGVILGTAAYMSPEQARGKPVDKRTDIWAFGVVLYELLTSKPLFQGDDVSETIAAVIMKEPDLSAVPAQVLPLLRRCLEKNPKQRLRDIGDMGLLLEGDLAPSTSVSHTTFRFGWVTWALAALATVLALGVGFLRFRETPPLTDSLRFQIPLPDNVSDAQAVISPDGRYLVFADLGVASGPLRVRPLNSLTAQPLAGTDGAYLPFWSPDSKSIGFFVGGKLKRIEVAGGPAITLADAASPVGGAWGPDQNGGAILFTPTLNSSPILRVPASGGTVSPVTKLRPDEASHRFPFFLPDGRHFLYLVTHEASHAVHNTIHVGDLSSPEDSVIREADSQAIYSQGFLLFTGQETLMAQPFDAQRRVATGNAAPLEQRIQQLSVFSGGSSAVSASANGLLVFRKGSPGGSSQLIWLDRSGKQLGTLGKPGNIRDLKFSPDRKSVAVTLGPTSTQNNSVIWIYDAIRGLSARFTFDPAFDTDPIWSPDGRNIIFASRRKQFFDLYRKSSDGGGNEELLYSDNLDKTPTDWSTDGKFLLYRAVTTGTEIWVLPLTPERPGEQPKPYPFVQSPFNESDAQFSPDGQWIAYNSDESQRGEVYVAHFPGAGSKRQISVAGGNTPRWRRDGKEIFYVAPDGKLMTAAVTVKGDAIQIGEVRPLFSAPPNISIDTFEVSADGQRFLILPEQQATNEGVTVILNWAAGLKK